MCLKDEYVEYDDVGALSDRLSVSLFILFPGLKIQASSLV